MNRVRARLPAATFKDPLLAAVAANQVVLVSGETGCGKTTQVPQFMLEDAIRRGAGGHTRIVCTQPRRLAAIGVATRVADERGETVGAVGGAVGYQIRGEKRAHPSTALLFTTTGVLLRRLNAGLGYVTHIVVDEVHERNVDTDFLLAILVRLLARRRDIKLVLMSATMDAAAFAAYFRRVNGGAAVPVLEIPGFVHPVREVYMDGIMPLISGTLRRFYRGGGGDGRRRGGGDGRRRGGGGGGGGRGGGGGGRGGGDDDDEEAEGGADDAAATAATGAGAGDAAAAAATEYDIAEWRKRGVSYALTAALVAHVASAPPAAGEPEGGGAVLVFLPGVPEIRRLHREMEAGGADLSRCHILHLHGNLTSAEQAAVFQRAPRGMRKVVLSTNVAETSVTIDDVTVVVDTLRVKELTYDHLNRTAKLQETWVSQASARQRRGRAGRTRPGVCYRIAPVGLLTSLAKSTTPEIHRTPLMNLCLQVKLLGLGSVPAFMASLLDPPAPAAVAASMSELTELGALVPAVGGSSGGGRGGDDGVQLTPLGHHLALLPVDVRLAKMLIMGAMLRCVDAVLTIAAALAERSPFRPLPPVMDPEERGAILAARTKFAWGNSDHLAVVRAFDMWRGAGTHADRRRFAADHGLSHDTLRSMEDLRADYAAVLADLGFLAAGRHGRRRDGGGEEGGEYETEVAGSGGGAGGGGGGRAAAATHGRYGERAPGGNACGAEANVIRAGLVAALVPNVVRIWAPARPYHVPASGSIPTLYKASPLRFFTLVRTASAGAGGGGGGGRRGGGEAGGAGGAGEDGGDDDDDSSSSSSEEGTTPAGGSGAPPRRRTFADERVVLHPGSVNFDVGEYRCPWLVYFEKSATSQLFIRDSSAVTSFAMLLFGGPLSVDHTDSKVYVGSDRWVHFYAEARIAALVRGLRDAVLSLLDLKVRAPHVDISSTPAVECILRLLISNGN